jgi:acetylornithine deacetylase
MIRTLLPGEDLGDAGAAIEAAVARGVEGTGVSGRVVFPAGRDHALGGLAFETAPDAPAVALLRDCLASVAPDRGRLGGAPFWSELSFLAALGIPGAYCAPGDIATAHTSEERVEVSELIDAVKALSLFIAGHCGAGRIQGAHP